MTPLSPLLGVLKQIQFWLETVQPYLVMHARYTQGEFERQQLPAHCKVRQGVAGVVHHGLPAPEDDMVEANAPVLIFVMNGQADLRVADYIVSCKAGDAILIPSGIPRMGNLRPHYEEIRPEAHCDLFFLRTQFIDDKKLLAHVCHSRGEKHEKALQGEECFTNHPLLPRLVAGLDEELQNRGNTKSTFHLLSALITLLQQEIEQGRAFYNWQFPSESATSTRLDPIKHAVEYMNNYIDHPLSIDQIARWVGLSRTVFIRLFRQQTGKSFKEYLTDLRLQRATDYLLQSNLSVNQISTLVGLTAGQLRNLFHQHHHCTPREFRFSHKYNQN